MKIFILLIILINGTPLKSNTLEDYLTTYAIIDLASGELIKKNGENRPMILASVTKLFTFFFALDTLGEDDHFVTKILKTGKVVKGELQGDLYLKGSGAPYLTANHLISLIQQVKNSGITKVKGNFYYDISEQLFTSKISPLGLEDQADNPSIGTLNVEFNRFRVWTQSNITHPPLEYFRVESTNRSSHGLKFIHKKGGEGLEVWSKNAQERMAEIEYLPVRDSNLYTVNFFHYLAKLHGLTIPPPKEKRSPKKAKEIAVQKGLPLVRLASLGIEYSNNLMAEMAMLKAVKKTDGKKESLEMAAAIMHDKLKKSLPQIDWSGSSFTNGSGLSLHNRVGTKTMVQFLSAVQNKIFQTRSFWSLLLINGHSGALARRLKHPSLAYRVYGKTGSLYFVNNLAGYFIGNSGKRYAFAIFTSHQKNRDILNKGNSEKANRLRDQSKQWYLLSTKNIDNKIRSWIERY